MAPLQKEEEKRISVSFVVAILGKLSFSQNAKKKKRNPRVHQQTLQTSLWAVA